MRVNYRVLSIYLLGVFIGALDTNVLGPAFRVIAANFHVTLGVTAWTITAYSVAYVAATALFGALGDRLGHRRIFGLGVALFGLASVVAAFSPNLTVFLLARSLQGHVDEKNGWPTQKLSKRATQIGSNDTSKTKHGAKHP